jgi:phospholipid/cholesterol/gamma-HCH transport system substrate-binding protein
MKSKKAVNNIKLGIFVLAGLFFLIIILYLIGKNEHVFGSNFMIKARFQNVQGLKVGNNVRFGGIDIGTVKNINIINDTLMEVEMIVDNKLKNILRKNAVVTIGTDGLVGNKVINIESEGSQSAMAKEGDILPSKKPINTDEMLRTLYKTNNDIGIIAEDLKSTIEKINNSEGLWNLMNNKDLSIHLSHSIENIEKASREANLVVHQINQVVKKINSGQGLAGTIINDTLLAVNLHEAVSNFRTMSERSDSLVAHLQKSISEIDKEITEGKGTVHSLLKDSASAKAFEKSLINIEKGTEGFQQNMEALKHNVLFKGYFKRMEKEKKKKEK